MAYATPQSSLNREAVSGAGRHMSYPLSYVKACIRECLVCTVQPVCASHLLEACRFSQVVEKLMRCLTPWRNGLLSNSSVVMRLNAPPSVNVILDRGP
jgi:hypothetical protein